MLRALNSPLKLTRTINFDFLLFCWHNDTGKDDAEQGLGARRHAGLFSGGGKIIYNIRGENKRGGEATERGGGGCSGGVGGVAPPPHTHTHTHTHTQGSFCIFEIEIEWSSAHFGGIFFKIAIKKCKKIALKISGGQV